VRELAALAVLEDVPELLPELHAARVTAASAATANVRVIRPPGSR
jgi:hypothetical protein